MNNNNWIVYILSWSHLEILRQVFVNKGLVWGFRDWKFIMLSAFFCKMTRWLMAQFWLYVIIMSCMSFRVNPHSNLSECQGTPFSKQTPYLKFKWQQCDLNPQGLSL